MRLSMMLLVLGMYSTASAQLATPENERRYRALLPKVADEAVQAMLERDDLFFYSPKVEMPQAYQDWEANLQGIHSPFYNISADNSEPFGNGNREFPWKSGGMDQSDNGGSFFFLCLPSREGRRLPVVHWRASDRSVAWRFPVGTVAAEVLWVKLPSGRGICFEFRTRVKDADGWEPDLFRPFPTAQDLAAALMERGIDSPYVKQSRQVVSARLVDSGHPNQSFAQTALIDKLPYIGTEEQVIEMVQSTPFRSCKNQTWIKEAGRFAAAPTTDEPVSIVPKGYQGSFLPVTRESCRRCHQQVNRNVRAFDGPRDWYGRIRGNDEIFSFHPFDPGVISPNGSPRGVAIRPSLVRAGIVAKFDPAIHRSADYPPTRR